MANLDPKFQTIDEEIKKTVDTLQQVRKDLPQMSTDQASQVAQQVQPIARQIHQQADDLATRLQGTRRR